MTLFSTVHLLLSRTFKREACMGQVIKISTTDFRAIHLSIGGRLVPSDLLDEARGRELRVSAIESRNVGKSDSNFQRAVNLQ